jgi:alkylhydroperoxidase family enzyme
VSAPTPKWQQERQAAYARAAARRPCPRCAADCLTGRGDDFTAVKVWVDAAPLPPRRRALEVVVALLTGREVFAVHCGELHRLDRMQLGLDAGRLVPPPDGRALGLRDPPGPELALHLQHQC